MVVDIHHHSMSALAQQDDIEGVEGFRARAIAPFAKPSRPRIVGRRKMKSQLEKGGRSKQEATKR